MATETLAAEKAAQGLVEEIKAAEDIVNVAQESPSQSKDLEEQDVEEKLKEDGLEIVEASEAGSEERSGNEKNDAVAENVTEKDKEEEDVQNSNSEILASDTAEKGEITKQEYDTLAVEPVVEVHEELMNHPDGTDIPEPPKEEIEKSAEDSEESLVKVSESEAAEELEVSSEVPKEEKPTEDIPEMSAVSETDSKSELPIAATITEPTMDAITSPDDAGSAELSEVENSSSGEHEVKCESSREEPPVLGSSKLEETSDKLPEVVISENSDVIPAETSPLNELEAVGEGTVTSPVVPDVTEKKTDNNQSASGVVEESVVEESASVITDSSPATETTEGIMKPEDEVEELMLEKAAVIEEQILSGTPQSDNAAEVAEVSSEVSADVEKLEEKKDETSEAVIETPESVDAATEVSQVEGEKPFGGVEAAGEKNERMEDADTTLVETSRDPAVEGGEHTSESVDAATEVSQVEGANASAEAEVAEENDERMEGEDTSLVETSRNLAEEEEKATSESVDAATEISLVEGEKASGVGEVAEEKNETVEEQTLSGTLQSDNAAEVAQVSSEGSTGVEKFEEKKDETSEAIIETPESVDAASEVSQLEGEKPFGGVEAAEEKNDGKEDGDTTLVETSRDLAVEGGEQTSESVNAATELSQVEGAKGSAEAEVAAATEVSQVEGVKGSGEAEVAAATEVSQVEGVKGSAEAEVAEENNERMEGENMSLVETSRNLVVEEGKATSESVDAATEISQVDREGEVAEEKNETVEGDNTTLVETTRDLDVEGLNTTDTTAVDMEDVAHEKEENEKAAEQNPVESAKDGGDTTTELPAKPSQHHSNNFFSKVKQSIVKVKKAIVGKSPNSKTVTAEGNDDIKVKQFVEKSS